MVPVFAGTVDRLGKVVLDNPPRFRTFTRTLIGKRIELVLRPRRVQRSLDQNAFCHAVPFALLAEYWGTSMSDTKLLVMGERFGWHEVRGQRLPIKGHTSELTTKEMSDLIEWLPPWAYENCAGLLIPLPNEVDY